MATVTFKLEGDEADAVRAFLKLSDAEKKATLESKKLARAGRKAGKDTAGGAKQGEGAMGKLTTGISGTIASYVSVGAVIAGIGKAMAVEFENTAQAAENAAKRITATRDLLFLGEFAKAHPEIHREIGAFAVTAALPGVEGKVEIAKAMELLVSKTPAMSDEQRMELFRKGLQFKRTTTSDLSTLINFMIQVGKADPGATPTAIANLIQQTKTEAGATTEAMARRLPQLFPVAGAAGVSLPEISALFAVATGGGFGPEQATTGIRMMLGRLQGKKLPKEARKVQRRLGLEEGMGVFEQLEVLSGKFQEGKFKLAESQLLFGEEAGPVVLDILKGFKGLKVSLGKIKRAFETPGLDLVGKKIVEVFAPGTLEFQEERNRRLKARKEQIRFEKDAPVGLAVEQARLERYLSQREKGEPHVGATIDAAIAAMFERINIALDYKLFFTKELSRGGGGEGGEGIQSNTEALNKNTDALEKRNGNGNGRGELNVNGNF